MQTTPHSCRTCGATSYRRVIARDDQGALRATELYQCSGCSVVFADPKAWREGGSDEVPVSVEPRPPASTTVVSAEVSRVPNLATYGGATRLPGNEN